MLGKYLDQKIRDGNRKTYTLNFPHELDAESITGFLRSISGTLQYGRARLGGTPTIGFELWATNKGIVHRLKVPWQHSDYVLSQLRSLVPGIRATPEEEWPEHKWTRAVEVAMSHSSRSLRIYNPAHTAASLLAAVQALEDGEALLVQWVASPAVPSHPPIYKQARSDHVNLHTLTGPNIADRDEVHDRREKLAEPNFLSVLRVASRAATEKRADHLIYRVRASLASVRSPANRFKRRLLPMDILYRRVREASGSMMFPIQLSAPELAALIAWPIGDPFVSGLPARLGRQFPPTDTVPRTGIVVGDSTFPGAERPIAIGYTEALMHTHVLGKTGVGKSVLLSLMAQQIMDAGHGLILMETEGNLYQSVLDYVPPKRVKDIILFDVADTGFPVGFNVLDQGDHATVIDEIIALFAHKYGSGIWSDEYILNGLRTLAERPELTLLDLGPLLTPTSDELAWADTITRSVKDPELRRWWQRHENRARSEQQRRADPVLSRLSQLSARPELRNILGQSKSTFQMTDVLKGNKILLVNLKGVSRDSASIAGTLLMNAIWHATKSGYNQQPTYLMLDEFGDFMDLPIDTESMLAQARKHQLGLILANQHMSQLSQSVRDGVISNARNKVIFQSRSEDARTTARELTGIEEGDITTLQAYEAVTSVMTPAGSSQPISIKTRPGRGSTGAGKIAQRMSRGTYGVPKAEVQKAMAKRFEVHDKNAQRPRISDWEANV